MPFQCIEGTLQEPVSDETVKPAHNYCKLETFCVELALVCHICSLYVVENVTKFLLLGLQICNVVLVGNISRGTLSTTVSP